MAISSRLNERDIIVNNDPLYKQKFFDKGVSKFIQYSTKKLVYPSSEEIQNLQKILHVWKQGDSYEKLSYKYYKDSNFWWVIAHFNQKPTEQHLSVGDQIYIPLPLYEILNIIG